jgi:hypothetical protein
VREPARWRVFGRVLAGQIPRPFDLVATSNKFALLAPTSRGNCSVRLEEEQGCIANHGGEFAKPLTHAQREALRSTLCHAFETDDAKHLVHPAAGDV